MEDANTLTFPDDSINPAENMSTTSASEDTEESAEEESQSEDEANNREEGATGKQSSNSGRDIPTLNYGEDLLLHSLESDQYGPSVQKYISKYLDDDLNTFLLSKSKARDKGDKDRLLNLQQFARTIKAATKHIDVQGKKAFSRQHSQSMINLAGNASSVTPPSTPNYDFSLDHGAPGPLVRTKTPQSPSTGIISVIESQILQEKEAVSPFRQQEIKRKIKKRQVHKIRIQERDAKAAEAEGGEGGCSSNGTMSIEAKSQFSCLPSRPNYQSNVRANISLPNSIKALSQTAPDCPFDRIQFFKAFSQTLRKGKKCGNGAFVSSNSLHPGAGAYDELVFKQELRDLIWLEVRGWVHSKAMIDEDSWLCAQRKNIPKTLQHLTKFSIVSQRSRSNSSATMVSASESQSKSCISPVEQKQDDSSKKVGVETTNSTSSDMSQSNDLRVLIDADKLAANVAMKLTINKEASVESEPFDADPSDASSSPAGEDDCSCSETLSRLCQFCVDKESEALEQVREVLNELDEVEQLYPCTKALAHDYPAYAGEPLSARMKSLHLYVNITQDMREKINLLAKLFHIQDRKAAGWPVYDLDGSKEDLNESCYTTPEIRQDVYGYSYRLSAQAPMSCLVSNKQVNFKQCSHLNKDSNSTQSSDQTMSAPESPDVQMPHSPLDNNSSGSKSSSHSSHIVNHQKQNIFFQSQQSIYRHYVDKALKHKGLRYIYHQLSHILRSLLYRVHAALKKPSSFTYADAVSSTSKPLTVCTSEHTSFNKKPPISRDYCEELSMFGVWSVAYQQMALPTFHRPFLFLLRVTIDVVHECLRLRLEQLPDQPSPVSVGQLIKECKEVIRAGVQIRQRYVNLAQTVLGEGGSDIIEAQLDTFDDDLKTMLNVYLKYLEQYMVCLQKITSQNANTLRQKGYLEEEWNFVRTFCPHIPGGEAIAANRFCLLASDLLTSIGDYIQTSIDECFVAFNESIAAAPQNVSIFRKGILSCCRKFKTAFQEASGRACQATAFAKSLRKDLEFAAEFQCSVDTDVLLTRLKATGHIRVYAQNCLSHIMFVPSYMQGSESYIWQLVDMTCGGRSLEAEIDVLGYLLVMACPDRELRWLGTTVVLEPAAESAFSLSHVQVDGVLFVVNQPSQLEVQSRQFQQSMIGTLTIHKQQTACNREIAAALNNLKEEALEIHNKISHSLNLIYDQLDVTRLPNLDDYEKCSLQGRCLDVIHQGFRFAFEYEKGLARLITGELKIKLSKQLVTFALQWIKFVVTKCEKGRGLKSRWSNQGLQYLMVALEPQYLQSLTDAEYYFLKTEVDNFLAYVGTDKAAKTSPITNPRITVQGPYSLLAPQSNKPLASSLNFQRSQSVNTVKGLNRDKVILVPNVESKIEEENRGTRLEDWAQKKVGPQNVLRVSLRKVKDKSTETTINECTPRERIQRAVVALDEKHRKKLQETGVIGDVSDVVIQRAPLHITARKVNFPWQRGFKIGEGRFGKVYTAVNNSTGELIAMKEIHLQPNDHRAVKETLDEIRTFEGIKHKNLVRYYGVEIHREDLYIFMEYCNEGTLESAVQLNLPEQLVRKYTRQLLEAVNVLHEHGIVHRDIKSANIFLTSDGHLKLGDFGCCMKLKNQTTMAGELNAFVGTPAYMAPEIFTKTAIEGHGRAADIWSIGCVTLEMLTGRRPWHDMDNSYQIMFKVGMGETPEIPDDLCEEGYQFISHCLIHDPRLRLSTGQLLVHPFTKVEDDDEPL